VHPLSGKIQAVAAEYLRNDWLVIDETVKADLDFLNREAKGDWQITSRSDDDRLWIALVDRLIEPVAFLVYDRGAKTFTKVFSTRPNLDGAPLTRMHAVEISARDGLVLPSYLTLPRDADPDGDGQPAQPPPMVLYVHGGPWARDSYGYNSTHQWLANRLVTLIESFPAYWQPFMEMSWYKRVGDPRRRPGNNSSSSAHH
jgi:dipeptidyl aminopeptidase/acylaminoacyl peptidase